MAKFVVFFRFKPETVQAMMARPSDRAAAVSTLCEAAGARMEAYYVMFGDWDGMVIVDGRRQPGRGSGESRGEQQRRLRPTLDPRTARLDPVRRGVGTRGRADLQRSR